MPSSSAISPQVHVIAQGVDSAVRYHSEVSLDSSTTAGQIQGSVVNATTGGPIRGAAVFIVNTGNRARTAAITDSLGRFHITTRIIGQIAIRIQSMGFKALILPVDTRTGVTAYVALTINPPRGPICDTPMPPGSVCI